MRNAIVAACLICALSSPAFGDGVADEADLQFQVGAEAYTKGDFTSALQHFLASNRLVPNRNVMFNIARAYEQLNRFADAYRYYVDASRGDVEGKLKNDVSAALARIAPKVGVINVETSPSGATVFLDRKDLGSIGSSPAQLGLKPGTYTVVAELEGYEPQTQSGIAIAIGEAKTIKLELVRILGKVELTGPRGTSVRIDDERGPVACVLPCTLDLPPGPHIAYFERPGFTVAAQQFVIIAKDSVRAEASSVAVVGSLLVSADEPNALIEVDGKAYGFTPAVLPNIPIGKRVVRVSLRGYLPVERTVEVRTNSQTELRDLVLTPERSVSAASRTSESIEDAPASVTVISSQELEAFAYPTILEALRGVRGVAINYDSVYGNAAVRGLGQANDFSNRLLVLSDGAVLNENILYQPFIHYDGRVDLGDVERIEIVRGPSSVLYGTGAVSGVVNLVLKGRDEPEGVQAQVSSYDNATTRVRAALTQRFSRSAGVWASAAGATSQGRDVSLAFDNGSGLVEPQPTSGFDKFNAYTLTGKGWYKDLTLQTFWTSRTNTVPTGNYSSRFGDMRSFGQDRRFLTELKLERTLANKTELFVRAHANYAYFHLDYWYDNDPAMPTPGTADTFNYFETYRSWWGGAEARATFPIGKKLSFSIGGEGVLHPKVTMENGDIASDGTMSPPTLDTRTPYSVLAAAALVDWRPSKKFRVQLGARFDYWNLAGNENAATPDEKAASSFPALSPRLAVIMKPTPDDIIKVMAGSAFRAPSAYEFFYNDGGTTQVVSTTCGTELTPENIYSLEIEETHRFSQDWVGLASIQGTLARNGIETVNVDDACAASSGASTDAIYYRNSDVDQRVLGLDLELRREFRAGFLASAQYGFSRARYADDSNTATARLANAPSNYAGLKVVFPIVQSTLTGAMRAALEDRRRIDTSTVERSERAVIADAVVSGVLGKLGVRYAAGVYNLFNWRYSLPAVPYSSTLMPQNGRSFMVSLTLYR
ncbi:MAG: TonB-dependent receptor domain-containing protein [Kofleriaceae bacterium]